MLRPEIDAAAFVHRAAAATDTSAAEITATIVAARFGAIIAASAASSAAVTSVIAAAEVCGSERPRVTVVHRWSRPRVGEEAWAVRSTVAVWGWVLLVLLLLSAAV